MRISKEAIKKIKDNNGLKAQLCTLFNKHFSSIDRWIITNTDNGPLTTVSAIEIIKKEIGLSEERILLREKVKA